MPNFSSLCPQLPITDATIWAAIFGGSYGNPPPQWTCETLRYYESDPNYFNASSSASLNKSVTCDCGCGVIDPDCGYTPQSCFNQTWEPVYSAIECAGSYAPPETVFCRLESATCMPLPPGLHFDRTRDNSWKCIPEVFWELHDDGTSLNDCDCNCGDLDPDCQLLYNNIYCEDYVDAEGTPMARSWEKGPTCVVEEGTAHCRDKEKIVEDCPQLPAFRPAKLVKPGFGKGRPPPGWTCDPSAYYESEGLDTVYIHTNEISFQYSCDCGCGVIDPDCGYELRACEDQSWNPRYTHFKCAGEVLNRDLVYCRLQSARCTTLPPGIKENLWTCIPDIYHELDDNMTTFKDCDCNCGSLDPDCKMEFENLYCLVNEQVISVPRTAATMRTGGRVSQATCEYVSSQTGATCSFKSVNDIEKSFSETCPQLPVTAPAELAARYKAHFGRPPALWSCDPTRYYELDPINALNRKDGSATCDCGCGVIDPDCGYIPASCFNQTWDPLYTKLECGGEPAPVNEVYCRLDSASCMRTPPGLHFDKSKKNSWTCIPDVYHELSDPDTTLDDCDCNCGDLDPDCQLLYNNIYCAEYLDVAGIPIPRSWEHGVTCEVDASSGFSGAHCVAQDTVDFACAQLPPVMPNQLVKVGAAKGRPPPEWTCAPEAYYESQGDRNSSLRYSCDCGCGVIDPDCGYQLKSCDDQSWNPRYSTFKCNGAVLNKEMMYCRLDSARCTALPPGIHDNLWTCIPDVYHELSDNGTKLDDCDCNCGSLDPDCLLDYNDLYCEVNGRVEKAEDATCVYKSRQTGAECLWKPLEVKLNQRVAEAVWALAIFSVIACLALTTSLVRHRESKLIKASSFAFSVALILACGVISASTVLFALPPEPSNRICWLRWWVPCIAASTVFGTLFSKTYRLFAIFRVFTPGKKVPHHIRFQDIKVAALVGAFVLGTFFLLGLYFLIDPPLYELNQFQVKGGPVYFFHACHVSPVFVPLIFALYTILLAAQSYLAYLVKDLPTVFNESRLIAWLLYNTVFIGLVGLVVDFVLPKKEITGKMLVRAVALLIGALTPVAVLYIPKFVIIWKELADTSKYSDSNTNSAHANLPSRVGSQTQFQAQQTTHKKLLTNNNSIVGDYNSDITPRTPRIASREVKKAVDARYQPDIELQYISNPHPLNNSNRSATDNRSQISAMSGLSDDGEEDFEIELAVQLVQEEEEEHTTDIKVAMLRGDADATIKEFLEVFPNAETIKPQKGVVAPPAVATRGTSDGKQQQQRKQPMLEKAATILQIQRDSLVDEVSEGLHESSNGATRFHGSRSNSNSNTPVLATRSLNQNKKAASNRNSPTGSKPGSNRDSPTMTRRSSVQHNRTRSVGRSPKILPEPAEARNLKTINLNETNTAALIATRRRSVEPSIGGKLTTMHFVGEPDLGNMDESTRSVGSPGMTPEQAEARSLKIMNLMNETNKAVFAPARRRSMEPSIGGKLTRMNFVNEPDLDDIDERFEKDSPQKSGSTPLSSELPRLNIASSPVGPTRRRTRAVSEISERSSESISPRMASTLADSYSNSPSKELAAFTVHTIEETGRTSLGTPFTLVSPRLLAGNEGTSRKTSRRSSTIEPAGNEGTNSKTSRRSSTIEPVRESAVTASLSVEDLEVC